MNHFSDENNKKTMFELDLAFKGERDYLHGTDIAHSLLSITGSIQRVTIQIHRMSSHPLIARYSTNKEIAQLRGNQELVAIMVFNNINKSRRFIALKEDFNKKVSKRYQYDESQVTSRASISYNQVEQFEPTTGNFFERVVALNKFLLNSIVDNHPWVFSRIDLQYAPVCPRKLSIFLRQEIGGHTYKSEISGDDVNLGNIFFTAC